MSDIRIPKALAQMDGIFGYQVVTKKDNLGQKQTSIVKKDFFDWVCDIFFKIEKASHAREKTIAAFKQVAIQIEGADDGQFKAIIEKYEKNNEAIDYVKIKETLAAALEYHPPRVHSRLVPISATSQQSVNFFKKLYSQNIKKSACNEEVNVELEIFRDGPSGVVSDANLWALMHVLNENSKSSKTKLTINEPNYVVKSRFKIINYQLSENYGTVHSREEALRQSKRHYRLGLMNKNPELSIKEVKELANTAYQKL